VQFDLDSAHGAVGAKERRIITLTAELKQQAAAVALLEQQVKGAALRARVLGAHVAPYICIWGLPVRVAAAFGRLMHSLHDYPPALCHSKVCVVALQTARTTA
jgi:hypothetical protein